MIVSCKLDKYRLDYLRRAFFKVRLCELGYFGFGFLRFIMAYIS